MQSEARIALPYIPLTPSRLTARSGRTRSVITPCLRSVLPDLLIGWDMLAVLLPGLLVVLAGQVLAAGEVAAGAKADDLRSDLMEVVVFGTLLAPLLLGARHPCRVDASVVRGMGQRVAVMIGLALMSTWLLHRTPLPLRWTTAWFASAVPTLLAGRVLANATLSWAAHRFGGERVAVLGRGNEAEWLRRTLRQAGSMGIDLVVPGRRSDGLDGTVADLLKQGQHGDIHRVILAQPGLSNRRMQQIEHKLKELQIEVTSLFPLLGAGSTRPDTVVADVPLFLVARRPQWGYGGLSKALIDRCLATLLLVWMTPLLLLIAIAVRIDSPGPVLFRQRRCGLNGGEFEIFKFRTMTWQGQAAGNGAVQTRRSDKRITRVGAVLRRSSLDEIPQLLNVLNGTMSLVGPRPHPASMRTEERLGEEITPDYSHRHRVKPGITGWAQVNGLRGATDTVEQLRRRVEHDNFYIENCGIM